MTQDSSLKAEWGKGEQRDVQRQKRIVEITTGRASEEPEKRHKQKMEPVYFPTMQRVQSTVLKTPERHEEQLSLLSQRPTALIREESTSSEKHNPG